MFTRFVNMTLMHKLQYHQVQFYNPTVVYCTTRSGSLPNLLYLWQRFHKAFKQISFIELKNITKTAFFQILVNRNCRNSFVEIQKNIFLL